MRGWIAGVAATVALRLVQPTRAFPEFSPAAVLTLTLSLHDRAFVILSFLCRRAGTSEYRSSPHSGLRGREQRQSNVRILRQNVNRNVLAGQITLQYANRVPPNVHAPIGDLPVTGVR